MSELIKNWLCSRLNIKIDIRVDDFADEVRDGRLVGAILESYGCISSEQLETIRPSDADEECKENYRRLCPWLQKIGIKYSNAVVDEIVTENKDCTALHFFYDLFLALEEKDWLYGKPNVASCKFNVNKIPEEEKYMVKENIQPLCASIVQNEDAIDLFKNKYRAIEDRIDAAKLKFESTLKRRERESKNLRASFYKECREVETYNEFNEYLKHIQEQKRQIDKSIVVNEESASNLVDKLKCTSAKREENRKLKAKYKNTMHNEIWHEILKYEEKKFDESLLKKILKQSQYEKQMITKLFEIREQKEIMTENRKKVDDEIIRQRKEMFENYLQNELDEIERQKDINELEKELEIELHNKLYKERLKQKYEKHYKECKEDLYSLVDVVTKTGDYELNHNENVPKNLQRQWKTLFFKGAPIYEIIKSIEKIVSDHEIEDNEDTELEKHRQNILNEQDLNDYLNWLGEWDLEILNLEEMKTEEFKILKELGSNVLGHIIHTLLLIKYPYPPPPIPADLPKFHVCACVVNLPDTSIVSILQKLLNKRNILIIQIEDAVNFCINTYKEEVKDLEVDNVAPEKEISKKGKEKPNKNEKKNKKSIAKEKNKSNEVNAVEMLSKEVQTPKIFDECELGDVALLGREINDYLKSQSNIPDHLILTVLIEYLKMLEKYNGWVLLNFPRDIREAFLFEQKLSGQTLKIHDLEDDAEYGYSPFGFRVPSNELLTDVNMDLRTSRLVPNPHPREEKSYESYLTAYIPVTQIPEDCDDSESYTSVKLPLDDFYIEQGIHYGYYYKEFDKESIKRLAKLIIGDFSLPLKKSVDLFGDQYEKIFDEIEQKGKDKKKKKEKGDTVSKKTESDVKKEEEVKIEEVKSDQNIEEKEESVHTIEELPIPEPKPGEDDWVYANLGVPLEIAQGLAAFWENIEAIYVDDIKQFFFIKRLHQSSIVPYVTFVINHCKAFINRPDTKQDYVYSFQSYYNSLDQDQRNDVEIKAELHCRLMEMRDKLWEISDVRMKESEEERLRIINENWFIDQLYLKANMYISGMQIEADRCVNTIQLLQDYYISMIDKNLETSNRLSKLEIPKLNQIVDTNSSNRRQSKVARGSFHEESANLFIKRTLIEPTEEINFIATPFNNAIINCFTIAMNEIEKWRTSTSKIINDIKSHIKKSTESKVMKKNKNKTVEPVDMKEIEAKQKLFEEWSCALDCEIQNSILKMNLLKEKACLELNTTFSAAAILFQHVNNYINIEYEKEIQSVTKLHSILCNLVESGVTLQQQLALVNGTFVMLGDELLYPDEVPRIPSLKEIVTDDEFTIEQLTLLFKIFNDISPSGNIASLSFIYILQDLMVSKQDDGREYLPKIWTRIDFNFAPNIVVNIFGEMEYIDWKDFIIYNFKIPFPTEKEILKLHFVFRSFDYENKEEVSEDVYKGIRFWYEINTVVPEEELRLALIKDLLFRMFHVRENVFNYTAFLLQFCKDYNPTAGLAKAISLVLESYICWDIYEEEEEEDYDDKKMQAYEQDETVFEYEGPKITEIFSGKGESNSVLNQSFTDWEEKQNTEYVSGSTMTVPNPTEVQGELQGEDEFPSFLCDYLCEDKSSLLLNKVYYIPIEALYKILKVTLPWHVQNRDKGNINMYKRLQNLYMEIGQNQVNVLAYKLLNHPTMQDLLNRSHKFKIISIRDVLNCFFAVM